MKKYKVERSVITSNDTKQIEDMFIPDTCEKDITRVKFLIMAYYAKSIASGNLTPLIEDDTITLVNEKSKIDIVCTIKEVI